MSKHIVLNCGYGNGPYLRSAEIALATANALNGDWKIIVPLLYGEKQRRIMHEEFGDEPRFIWDEEFGQLHRSVFFSGEPYANFLAQWTENVESVSTQTNDYLADTYGDSIAMEISRAPLLNLSTKRKYFNSFSRTSDILQAALAVAEIAIGNMVLASATEKMRILEESYDAHFISIPGTFEPRPSDIAIPPSTKPKSFSEDIEPGVYVTCSGIPNVTSLQEIADSFGLPIYTNDNEKISGATRLPPSALSSRQIVAHIARSGWGAVWSSLLTETPLITPTYDTDDDPEIFFNNRRITELGIGAVWKNQTSEEVAAMRPVISAYKNTLTEQFGGMSGAELAAEKIAALEV